MSHPVFLTLLFHPADPVSKGIAEAFEAHFDKLGMQRDGVHMRIPIRVRAEALSPDGAFLPISRSGTELDGVVVLYGLDMAANRSAWEKICINALADGFPLLGFIVHLDQGMVPFEALQNSQNILWWEWTGQDATANATRLMIHIVNAVRRKIFPLPVGQREPIFISHAKSDGKLVAERLVNYISNTANGLRLNTFYDALQLESGEDWEAGLRAAAGTGSILALVSDAYDARPWCNQELIWAKEHCRAILLVDIGCKRVERCFPYSGNLTFIKDKALEAAGIEIILLELLSEALRCDLFKLMAASATAGNAVVLPRPPELADLAFIEGSEPSLAIVYPDPPVSSLELQLLSRLANGRRIVALSDF